MIDLFLILRHKGEADVALFDICIVLVFGFSATTLDFHQLRGSSVKGLVDNLDPVRKDRHGRHEGSSSNRISSVGIESSLSVSRGSKDERVTQRPQRRRQQKQVLRTTGCHRSEARGFSA